jgi:hypothetical protein
MDYLQQSCCILAQIVSHSFFLKGFQRVGSDIPKHSTQKLLVGIEFVRKLIRMQKELDFSYSYYIYVEDLFVCVSRRLSSTFLEWHSTHTWIESNQIGNSPRFMTDGSRFIKASAENALYLPK